MTIRDGCGCCEMCARQVGEPCDSVAVCDESKDLVCQYNAPFTSGTCQGKFYLRLTQCITYTVLTLSQSFKLHHAEVSPHFEFNHRSQGCN